MKPCILWSHMPLCRLFVLNYGRRLISCCDRMLSLLDQSASMQVVWPTPCHYMWVPGCAIAVESKAAAAAGAEAHAKTSWIHPAPAVQNRGVQQDFEISIYNKLLSVSQSNCA